MVPTADKTETGTRERLLDTAEQLFVERGFEGVSVRDITDAAGVNVAAVNYHFQGKANLYRAVLRRLLAPVAERRLLDIREAAGSGPVPDLRSVVRAYVAGNLRDMLASPEMECRVNMVCREMSESGIAADVLFEELVSPVHRALKDVFHRARPALSEQDASLCITSLVGQIIHFVRARELIRRVTGRVYSRRFVDRIIGHITEFSLRGIGRGTGEE